MKTIKNKKTRIKCALNMKKASKDKKFIKRTMECQKEFEDIGF